MNGRLGLPAVAGIPLIFGVLCKELTLILLAEAVPLESLASTRMIAFALGTTIYVLCLATIAACRREFGWRRASAITVIDVALALFIGGLAYRFLPLIMPT